jgi:hypothetical protein
VHGDVMVSTELFSHGWQVDCSRYEHKKINANKIKNAFANLFGEDQEYAFA